MTTTHHDHDTTTAVLEHARPHYDCVLGNVVTGAGWLGVDLDPFLGAVLSLEPRRTAEGWDLLLASCRQMEAATAGTGLRIATVEGRHLPGPSEAGVLVGDGGEMPWTPYWARQSLEHSFLVLDPGAGHVAFDSYDTITEHGTAAPARVDDDWRQVDVDHTLVLALPDRSPRRRRAAAQAFLGTDADREAYLGAVVADEVPLDRLAVDTWLLGRAREVNLRFAASHRPDLVAPATASRDAWTAAAEAVYVASRRERRGRPVPRAHVDRMHEAFAADVAAARVWERAA